MKRARRSKTGGRKVLPRPELTVDCWSQVMDHLGALPEAGTWLINCLALSRCCHGLATLFATRCVPGDAMMQSLFTRLVAGFVHKEDLFPESRVDDGRTPFLFNLPRNVLYCRMAAHVSPDMKRFVKQLDAFTGNMLLYINQG